MRVLDLVFEAMDLTERVVARLRGKQGRKLAVVPDPPEPKDPFTKPADPGRQGLTDDDPLGDPALPAQVYGRRGCMWTGRAIRLLTDRGIEHTFVDLDAPEHATLEPRIVRETKRTEMPWVFVRGELVGGYDALDELDRLGQLEILVLPSAEREARRGRGIRIEVPRRATQPDRIGVDKAEATPRGGR